MKKINLILIILTIFLTGCISDNYGDPAPKYIGPDYEEFSVEIGETQKEIINKYDEYLLNYERHEENNYTIDILIFYQQNKNNYSEIKVHYLGFVEGILINKRTEYKYSPEKGHFLMYHWKNVRMKTGK